MYPSESSCAHSIFNVVSCRMVASTPTPMPIKQTRHPSWEHFASLSYLVVLLAHQLIQSPHWTTMASRHRPFLESVSPAVTEGLRCGSYYLAWKKHMHLKNGKRSNPGKPANLVSFTGFTTWLWITTRWWCGRGSSPMRTRNKCQVIPPAGPPIFAVEIHMTINGNPQVCGVYKCHLSTK